MTSSLPTFTYHPDPVGTGSFTASVGPCVCCGQARGYLYTGPVYAVEELDDALCPWCIADGSAADRFDATLTDAGTNAPADAPAAVVRELEQLTPGFSGWQQERWLYHCGDGCAFLGPIGAADLDRLPGARAAVEAALDTDGLDAEPRALALSGLDRRHGPTAYLFRCRHCSEQLAYWDCA